MKEECSQGLLNSFCLKTDQWNPKKERRDSFYYIDVSSVSNENFTIKSPPKIEAATAPGRARKIVKYQDTIYATIRPTLKRIAFINKEYDDQIASTAFCVVRPDQNKVFPLYVFYALLSDTVNNRIAESQHGASYPTVTDKVVLNQSIPLFEINEQQKIATILFKIQKAIEIQEKIIETTRELKKSTMQHVFTYGLRDEKTKETEIGGIPKSWNIVRIGDCCDIKSSTISFNELEKVKIKEQGVFCHAIKVSDMNLPGNEKWMKKTNMHFYYPCDSIDNKAIPANSIIFPKRGAAISTNKKRLTTQWTFLDPNLIAVIPISDLNHEFLYYWFTTFDLTKIQDLGPTPQLNKKDVEPLLLPCPEINEQIEIVTNLSTIDKKDELHTAKKSALQDLFKTMLNKLTTGEIRVKDLEIDVSEIDI